MLALAVALGAAVGAPLRFLTERAFVRIAGDALPWGTLVVNVVGSAALGAVVASGRAGGLPDSVVLALGTGFCGALTTFSGFSAQVLELRATGLAYALISLVLGVLAAVAGYAIAS